VALHRRDPNFGPEPEELRPEPAPRVARPVFSYALMVVCFLVFLPQLGDPESLRRWALWGPGIERGQWWRVLTSSVEHFGAVHLIMNGSSILGFGPFVEKRVGSVRLALVSLIAALVGAASSLTFNWNVFTAGASGIISGWIGLSLPIVEPRWRRVLVQWTILLVLISLIPGVSWAGHLGGFLAGLVSGVLMRWSDPLLPPRAFRWFDRLAAALVLLAAGMVYLVLQRHSGAGPL
jgi:membrane associated rhomboid family serine protease